MNIPRGHTQSRGASAASFSVVELARRLSQAPHGALPMLVLNLPTAQAVHAPPSDPVYPALHRHAASAALAATAAAFAGHAVHCALPCVFLYVSTAHPAQGPVPASPLNPGSHAHACRVLALSSACDAFAGHRSQPPLPRAVLYVLKGHAAHGPPCGPVKPGSHSQSDSCVLPATLVPVFRGHSVHALAFCAANVCKGHRVQSAAPCPCLANPAAHGVQESLPVP